jgi:cell division protein FtsI/penicillin-binding protein 2
MLAAIPNRGALHRPTLVRELNLPGPGGTAAPPEHPTEALSSSVNAELVEALAQTAVTGTMRGLADTVGRKIWVKTGTNDLVPPGSFVRVNSWLAGFIDTDRGPVAFAVVQEAPDGVAGAARNRHLVTLLGKALVAP